MERKGGFLISQIKQINGRIINKLLSKNNLKAINGEQVRILIVLWQKDGISSKEISKGSSLAINTLTTMLDRMEKSGLIARKIDAKDRRKTLVYLTKLGKDLQEPYAAISAKMEKIFYHGFSEPEIKQLETYLQRILENQQRYEETDND